LNADNNVVSNSQCRVYGAGSTSTISVNTLTLTPHNTGWQPAGTVTVP
jgi:hypothetical protein